MMNAEIVDTAELREKPESGPLALIDVRLVDDFAAGRISGASDNCVFEIDFPDRRTGACPDK